MRLRPTLRASHLSWGGLAAVAGGILTTHPAMVAYGAAMLCGVALSRALTRVSVARARAAGFEMLWSSPDPVKRVTRGQEVSLVAELRNRDNLPTRFRNLSISHSPHIEIECDTNSGEVPANGKLSLVLRIRPLRVGFQGIHSLTLHTIRAPGLYTIPLSFSNPFVLEVLPRAVRVGLPGAMGGRSRSTAAVSKSGRRRGEGTELRELREHRPGDPYKKIAWKASARRGRLLIVEKDQEESDRVWIVVDSSVDCSSGPAGRSALDGGIDQVVSTIDAHLAAGDSVGLLLVGKRCLARHPPGRGPKHAAKMVSALTLNTHTADADRSDWDDGDVAKRAHDHMLSLTSEANSLRHFEHEKLAALAQKMGNRAPVSPDYPWSTSRSDSILRRYLLSFGIQPPARESSDRHQVEHLIAKEIKSLTGARPRPTVLYLFARPPSFETPQSLLSILKRIPKKRTEVRFVPLVDSLGENDSFEKDGEPTIRETLVSDALSQRQKLATEDGIKRLQELGVKQYQPRKKRGGGKLFSNAG